MGSLGLYFPDALDPRFTAAGEEQSSAELLVGWLRVGSRRLQELPAVLCFPRQVFCDMETDGGGWTLIQRRQDGSMGFQKTWEEYKEVICCPGGSQHRVWAGDWYTLTSPQGERPAHLKSTVLAHLFFQIPASN